MTRETPSKAGARLAGAILALAVCFVVSEAQALDLAVHEDARTRAIGTAMTGSGSFVTSCAVSLFCQPMPGLLPDYGWSTTTGSLRILCLLSMTVDAALTFKRELDLRSGVQQDPSLLNLWQAPQEQPTVTWSPAITTLKDAEGLVGIAVGLNGTF
jgi:hypothetical protein